MIDLRHAGNPSKREVLMIGTPPVLLAGRDFAG
jgi:hypothetical protein